MALENKTILITGGLGQVGIALIQHLQPKYPTATLHVLDLKIPESTDPRCVPKVNYHVGNITDESAVSEIFEIVKPEVVFHTAGLIPEIASRLGMNNEESFMKVNYEATKTVLEESRKVGVKAFIFTSSADVVKGESWMDLRGVDEETPIPEIFDVLYAKSKARAETYVLSSSSPILPTTALRTHAIFSSHDANLLPIVISAPRTIRLGPGTNKYDFTYAPNLALAHELAALNLLTTKTAEGKAFFVTNAEPVEFRTFFAWVREAFDGKEENVKVTAIPIGVAKVFVWISDQISKITGKEQVLTMKKLGDSVAERWFDNSRAKDVLGYVPEVGIREGVRRAVEGYKIVKEREGKGSS